MNPFNLRGPEFLLFYLALAALTFLVLWALDRRRDRSVDAEGLLRDPYLIAGLRGGESDIVRVATLALLARGRIVEAGDHRVGLAPAAAGTASKQPLTKVEEAVLLELAGGPVKVARLERKPMVRRAAEGTLEALRAADLLPSPQREAGRRLDATLAGVLLAVVAGVKLLLALQRGRPNVFFLIVLAGLAMWGCVAWARAPRRTSAGRRVLRDLRALFGTKLLRYPRGVAPEAAPELLLSAAVCGIAGGPFLPTLRVRRTWNEGSSSSGCGAGLSCSSGCGGSCGGGCGGCGS